MQVFTYKNHIKLRYLKEGGRLRSSHIKYGCFTQNNLLYKNTVQLKIYLYPFLTQAFVFFILFCVPAHPLDALRRRPHNEAFPLSFVL